MNPWFFNYYKGILQYKRDPNCFWAKRNNPNYACVNKSCDGKYYSVFYEAPLNRLKSYSCWMPFLMFIWDEYE
jgi:hypothetical protein